MHSGSEVVVGWGGVGVGVGLVYRLEERDDGNLRHKRVSSFSHIPSSSPKTLPEPHTKREEFVSY